VDYDNLPSSAEVAETVRRALYSASPYTRANAEAQLIAWYLPISHEAIVLAARREQQAPYEAHEQAKYQEQAQRRLIQKQRRAERIAQPA
jgi:hypothetical protein